MKIFKKNIEQFLSKNNIRYKEGTPERLYQDLRDFKSKLKVRPERGQDKYRTAKYCNKAQLDIFKPL